MVDSLYSNLYNVSGSLSNVFPIDIGVDSHYEYSDTIVVEEDIPNNECEITQEIGHYKLPFSVTIRYKKEEEVICALCDKLSIVSCAYDAEEAKNGLEQELEDAIRLYVHIVDATNLDSKALKYREILSTIERLNTK